LLDTCVVAELRKPDGSVAVKEFVAALPSSSLFLSVITIGEIAKGIALLPAGAKKRSLETWLLGLSTQFNDRILVLDQEAAETWGELSANGKKKGFTIPVADGQIAATAIRHGLQVVTRNTEHFEQAGALVENPWEAAGAVR
jgi:predicted nucleic acid-binding protein